MKCRNCKSDIPDELHFVFCGYCGERLIKERKKEGCDKRAESAAAGSEVVS